MMSLSILFKTKIGLRPSTQHCRKTLTVCDNTPSTTSTKTTAPSHKRDAVDTSDEKSMWPGESIKFIKCSLTSILASAPSPASWACFRTTLKYNEMADASMVMPRSCSSSLESRKRAFPAIRWEMMPFVASKASEREVLPWSTCARMQMFLMQEGSSCSLATVSGESLIVQRCECENGEIRQR